MDSWLAPNTLDEPALESISIGAVIRRAGPRLVRDAFGPLAIFFAGWKLIGLTAGIGMAALFGVSVLAWSVYHTVSAFRQRSLVS